MSVTEPPGLRERKRVATRKAIQSAVVELALERGLEHVTVEEISRRADISPRTFFNYFVSKEAAIVGDSPALLQDDALAVFVAGGPSGDLLLDLGELMANGADQSSDDREMLATRRDLHNKYPHLFALRMAGMRAFEDELTGVVEQRFVHDEPALAADRDELHSRARLVTLVAFGALRHAWTAWADATDASHQPLAAQIRESFGRVESILVSKAPG